MRRLLQGGMVAAGVFVMMCRCAGQEAGRITVAVTYRTATTVYLEGGRNRALAVGDTGIVLRRGSVRLVITAISSSSSAASLVSGQDSIAIGDSVLFLKQLPESAPLAAPVPQALPGTGGTVHGRVALQYAGTGELGKGVDYSRPSLLLSLVAGRLLETPVRFTMYGRLSRNLTRNATTGELDTKWDVRVFDMTLTLDEPGSWYGVALGRVTSLYVGGLGLVDGGQFFARSGDFTAGVLLGLQPDYRTSAPDADRPRGALFLNYAWDSQPFRPSSTTLAYGRQLYKGALDREYAYLQNVFSLNSSFYFYQSSEVDLRQVREGVEQKTVHLTNTFVSLNFQPEDLLSVSVGYDANRPPEFLESARTLADSLLDREIKQGFRGSLFFRLPYRVTLGVLGGYRLKTAETRDGYNAGGSVRVSDILESGFSVGARYNRLRGVYVEGNDASVDLEQMIAGVFRVSLALDRYVYTPVGGGTSARTTTATANASWLISRAVYVTLTGDRVWDSGRDLYRLFFELGYHF